jgi:hypothetical protein
MPSDELETVLRLVAEGHLTAEQAAPIIEALTQRSAGQQRMPDRPGPGDHPRRHAMEHAASGRHLRIRVTEHGRQVVNLRIPLAFAGAAVRAVPGIGQEQAARIRQAIDAHALGPIIDVEDDAGDGVLISLE